MNHHPTDVHHDYQADYPSRPLIATISFLAGFLLGLTTALYLASLFLST